MIIVRFTSGLGNQMFQYNLYSLLRERFPGTAVKADLTWFARFSEHQGFELLRLFSHNPQFRLDAASSGEIVRCSGRIPNRVRGRAGEVWQFILRIPHRLIRTFSHHERIHIDQTGFEDNGEILNRINSIDPRRDYYITGFFIEEVYYRDRLDYLRRALAFDGALDGKNARYASMIRESGSVSVHVRRGDYLSEKYSGSFICLGEDYYRKAAELAAEKVKSPRFFIFSDDEDFALGAFDWMEDKVVVTGNTGRESYRDMQLMSMCRVNIIANSTFSLWAGLLNSNEDAAVYYPSAYMKQKDTQIMTLKGWIRV